MTQFKEDTLVFEAIEKEAQRQKHGIELIASENFVSPAVLRAQGSILTNKYAEGYPNRRYYGGCEYVDVIEQLAIDRVKELFGAEYANVQPHSGSQANMAAYRVLVSKGDKILGMDLSHGGHLTHGMGVNFSGQDYDFIAYGLNPETEMIDYDALEEIAKKFGAKFVYQEWLGYGAQRNKAIDLATSDWVLNIDADEEKWQDTLKTEGIEYNGSWLCVARTRNDNLLDGTLRSLRAQKIKTKPRQ